MVSQVLKSRHGQQIHHLYEIAHTVGSDWEGRCMFTQANVMKDSRVIYALAKYCLTVSPHLLVQPLTLRLPSLCCLFSACVFSLSPLSSASSLLFQLFSFCFYICIKIKGDSLLYPPRKECYLDASFESFHHQHSMYAVQFPNKIEMHFMRWKF